MISCSFLHPKVRRGTWTRESKLLPFMEVDLRCSGKYSLTWDLVASNLKKVFKLSHSHAHIQLYPPCSSYCFPQHIGNLFSKRKKLRGAKFGKTVIFPSIHIHTHQSRIVLDIFSSLLIYRLADLLLQRVAASGGVGG